MGRHDWYRKTTWTEADQIDFWERFRRARSAHTKPQYLRIQALYLQTSNPKVALELLEKLEKDYPESSQMSSMALQRGRVLLEQGKVDLAIKALEASLVHEEAFPTVRTQAWSVFGWAVVKYHKTELYEEAEKQVLANIKRIFFPDEKYRAHAILALIHNHRKARLEAIKHAEAALAEVGVAHSGFSRHPNIGLVVDPDSQILEKLKALIAAD